MLPLPWIDALAQAAEAGETIAGISFPRIGLQKLYVGRSGSEAIREVVPFTELILPHIDSQSLVVDFGAGWGRIARLFAKTLSPENLILADVSDHALNLCVLHNVPGTALKLDAGTPVIPLASGSVDYVYAFSVFTHLSEAAAAAWLDEFHRILKPGQRALFTILGRRFLDLVVACNEKEDANDIERRIGGYLGPAPRQMREAYQAGRFAFHGKTSGTDLPDKFYGWAALPLPWFERRFAGKFAIKQVIDDPARFEQVVVEVQKL